MKKLNDDLELKIIFNEGDEIWKKTKQFNEAILKSNYMETSKLEKIVRALNCLLFCKEYSNGLVHGKGKYSSKIVEFYEKQKEIPIISVASYENMKNVTNIFFGNIVDEVGIFKIINSLLSSKMEKWANDDEYDFSEYLCEGQIDCKNVINDFKIAVSLFDYYDLGGKINDSLENKNN